MKTPFSGTFLDLKCVNPSGEECPLEARLVYPGDGKSCWYAADSSTGSLRGGDAIPSHMASSSMCLPSRPAKILLSHGMGISRSPNLPPCFIAALTTSVCRSTSLSSSGTNTPPWTSFCCSSVSSFSRTAFMMASGWSRPSTCLDASSSPEPRKTRLIVPINTPAKVRRLIETTFL